MLAALIALSCVCAHRAIAAMPTPAPTSPAPFRSAMERELIFANPILAKKRIAELRAKFAAQDKKERDARDAALRAAAAAFLDAELLANNPQAVIAAQRKQIDSLRAESAKQAKALADASAARDKAAKDSAAAAEALGKRVDELAKKIEDLTKALDEKQKQLQAADEEIQKRLKDRDEQEAERIGRIRRQLDRLRERSIVGFKSFNFDGIEFVKIPAGEFMMGASPADIEGLKRRNLWSKLNLAETPARKVSITRPFLISQMEITQAQWEDVMGKNPSAFKKAERPVESISWDDAQAYLAKLSERTGAKYRLPTEAEWEYACRAGGDSPFGAGADGKPITFENINDYAATAANTKNKTDPCGKKAPNAWNLHDMNGNVWEWCADWFDPKYYERAPQADPLCSDKFTERSFRGGCWALDPEASRAAFRGGNLPGYKSQYVGLRVVREIAPD